MFNQMIDRNHIASVERFDYGAPMTVSSAHREENYRVVGICSFLDDGNRYMRLMKSEALRRLEYSYDMAAVFFEETDNVIVFGEKVNTRPEKKLDMLRCGFGMM